MPSSGALSMPGFVLEALQPSDCGLGTADRKAGKTRLATSSSTAAAAAADSDVTQSSSREPGAVSELVACLTAVDALDDAKTYMLLHARAGVRQAILRYVTPYSNLGKVLCVRIQV